MKLNDERVKQLSELGLCYFRDNHLYLSHHLNYKRIPRFIQDYCGFTLHEKIYRYLLEDKSSHLCEWCDLPVEFKAKKWKRFCGRECMMKWKVLEGKRTTGYNHTKETRKIMSENHANFFGDNNPLREAIKNDPSISKKISNHRKKWWNSRSNEYMEWFSERMSKVNSKGKTTNRMNNHKCGYYKSHKTNNSFWYRSSWEEQVCRILDSLDKVIYWSLEEITIKYKNKDDKNRWCRIDFLVKTNEKTFIIEVKPASLVNYGNNAEKINTMKQYCKEHHFEFILLSENFQHIITEAISNDNS